MEQQTLEYYNRHAAQFAAGTVAVDFTAMQEAFCALLPAQASILDFGCGSGRDTRYFLEQGYQVDAVDGSQALCQLASRYTGIPVRQMLFQQLDAVAQYDGIWACSSILHLPKEELKEVLQKIHRALKQGGHLYTSFKYGDFSGQRNGRYFTDFTLEGFQAFTADLEGWRLVQHWVTGDVRPGRAQEQWLNLILQKTP